jgi:hypothetical protein
VKVIAMTSYTTRVELHDAVSGDYTKLHVEMKKQGFKQTITGSDGKVYNLPTAEYNYIGDKTLSQVKEAAKLAAGTVKKSFGILVTESAARSWHNLI